MFGKKTYKSISKDDNYSMIWPKNILSSYQPMSLSGNPKIGRVIINRKDIIKHEDEIRIKGIKDYNFNCKNVVKENKEYIILENKYFFLKILKTEYTID